MPTDVPMITVLAAFGAAAGLFIAVWMLASWWLQRKRAGVQRRLRPGDDSDPTLVLDDMFTARTGWQRFVRACADALERTELQVTPFEALSIILFCGVTLAAFFFFWRFDEGESWLAYPAFAVGAGLPLGYFFWKQRAWRKRLQDQLPDTLFLMARSLRAGMSIDQSVKVIGDHGVAPMSREFGRMHRQLDLGLNLGQVLRSAAERVRLVDFSVFASVLTLHRNTGGNLPVLMDRLAETTRDHNQMRGYYLTATSMGRYGNIIILGIGGLLLFYLFFFQRDLATHYFESKTGLTLFGVGIGLMTAAMVLFYFLTRADEA